MSNLNDANKANEIITMLQEVLLLLDAYGYEQAAIDVNQAIEKMHTEADAHGAD
jgi:response regulator of citrate/malate metabolism